MKLRMALDLKQCLTKLIYLMTIGAEGFNQSSILSQSNCQSVRSAIVNLAVKVIPFLRFPVKPFFRCIWVWSKQHFTLYTGLLSNIVKSLSILMILPVSMPKYL
ncbi:MAG: hypothetical protein IPP42_10760 [Saprospiraceae bacterium]|nr:hypothetical protein [Saprospiraceae bacterium]